MLDLNKIYCGDCLEVMKSIDDNSIDLTVTSPPYDNLRTYEGYTFDFEGIAHELYRITKEGGVVVWVVNDATINGSETGTSFRQALYFKDECGFNLHDTMIWNKNGFSAVGSLSVRYSPVFEFMFILVKGKLNTFNPILDKLNTTIGTMYRSKRLPDGSILKQEPAIRREIGQRYNIWSISPTDRSEHPAIFPEQLATDHIKSWSNEGDLVLDPMCGSGTTCSAAKKLLRNYIGIDISEKYCKIAEDRLRQETIWSST